MARCTLSAISRKRILPARNWATAASLAPLRMAPAVPPVLAASRASFRHRKVSRSGWAKVSGPQFHRSSSLAGPGTRWGQVRAYWMGRRISAEPSWAIMALSQYSTRE